MRFSFLSDRADFLDRFDGVLHEFSIVFDGFISSLKRKRLKNEGIEGNFTFSNSREASQVSSFP